MALPLPIEVIENILGNLSANELFYVSTICKAWNKSVSRLLYRFVDIYTTRQYRAFIHGLKSHSDRVVPKMEKNGHQVRHLILHTCNIMLSASQVKTLKNLCPMINEFDYAPHVPITDEHLCYFMPGWDHLTTLPSWHEDKHKNWIPKLGGQLTHIYCFIEELAFLPSFINSTPLFPCLVDLKLSLHYVGPPISVSWMEMLDDQCPALTSLDMEFMSYDIGSGTMGDWKPAENLRTLRWRIDSLVDYIWYTYLSRKYPNVRELELQIGVDDFFEDFPSPNDQEKKELMRIAHKDSIFNMVTNFQQLTSFKIIVESKQRSYRKWYPFVELASWLGTPAAIHIKKLFWRTDIFQSGFSIPWTYAAEESDDEDANEGDSGHTMVAVDDLDPLGNINALEELAYDVPIQLPGSMTKLCAGTLVLENLTSLELFFSRKYKDPNTWEHLDMNMLLHGCPHLKTLGLAGVNSAVEGVSPQHSQQGMDQPQKHQRIHSRLTHLRLHHAIINDDDYLTDMLKRCPNVTKLKLYDCRIYQRHTLERQQTQQTQPDNNDKRPTIRAYTIDIPDHCLSLVDIRALRLMNFADAPRGYLFDTLQLVRLIRPENLARTTYQKDNIGVLDQNENNRYMVQLSCRYADKVIFDVNASFGDSLYHEY
ncbi:hypothetical protein BCR42DRAFT_405344 [Absidia repens]|uniref:F-box domain-containing protein n=1 Tax=Absidia repens TaxID=90262 RepID=A0A1X2ITA6_9FUNG|nr:hypothetical protein BCR42DRAFT_405344 [Absidia repens]